MKKFLLHILSGIIFGANVFAQDNFTASQAVYDLGLVSQEMPLLANRNCALLLSMNQFQVGTNFTLADKDQSILSIAGPIGYNLAIGMSWNRLYYEKMMKTDTRISQKSLHSNQFIISLAHILTKNIHLGQHLKINSHVTGEGILLDKFITSPDSLWEKSSYSVQSSYYLGVFWKLRENILLGIISPPIIEGRFQEFRVSRFEFRSKTRINYLCQKLNRKILPEFAVEYLLDKGTALVSALGKNNNDIFFHFSVRSNLFNRIDLTTGYEYHEKDKIKWLPGFGTHYGGFHAFYCYDLTDNINRVTISFSPVQEKSLIELIDFRQYFTDIFLYKKQFYQTNSSVSGLIKNMTGERV